MLSTVRGVDIEFIVVNSDFIIRVTRSYRDLYVGRKEIKGGRGVERVDSSVLEDKMRFCWTEDEVNEEDGEEY